MKIDKFYTKLADHPVIISGGNVEFEAENISVETLAGALAIEDERNIPAVIALGYDRFGRPLPKPTAEVDEDESSESVDVETEKAPKNLKGHPKKKH